MTQSIVERLEAVVANATTARFLAFTATPARRCQVLPAQAPVDEIFESNRFVVHHIHHTGPAAIDGGEQGSSGIIHMDPVAELLSIPWALTAGKPLQASIERAVRPMQGPEPKDADVPILNAGQDLFAFQQYGTMAWARIRRRCFINPAVVGIAVHRATARIEDLLEFGQAWQQRLQASQAVDEGAAVAIRINLTIPFWTKADDGNATSLKCGHQLVGLGGVAKKSTVSQLLQTAESFLPRRGQSQGPLLPSGLQLLSQCCAHISAAKNRHCHGLASGSMDPRELLSSLLIGAW